MIDLLGISATAAPAAGHAALIHSVAGFGGAAAPVGLAGPDAFAQRVALLEEYAAAGVKR